MSLDIDQSKENSEIISGDKVVFGVSVNILILGFTSLFTDMSSEMLISVFPLFLPRKPVTAYASFLIMHSEGTLLIP